MYFLSGVIDLELYNKEGNLITKLEGTKKNSLKYSSLKGYGELVVTDVFFNLKLLEVFGQLETSEELSDFEKELNRVNEKTKRYIFGERKVVEDVKLIGKGGIYSTDGDISHDFRLIIPNASLSTAINFYVESGELFMPTYKFSFPSSEESFIFEITEREQ